MFNTSSHCNPTYNSRFWGPWRMEGTVVDGKGGRVGMLQNLANCIMSATLAVSPAGNKVQVALMELYRSEAAGAEGKCTCVWERAYCVTPMDAGDCAGRSTLWSKTRLFNFRNQPFPNSELVLARQHCQVVRTPSTAMGAWNNQRGSVCRRASRTSKSTIWSSLSVRNTSISISLDFP